MGTINQRERNHMDQVSRIFKSIEMKEKNANKAKLNPTARAVYLAGIASLTNCEAVAKSGNGGRGYTVS